MFFSHKHFDTNYAMSAQISNSYQQIKLPQFRIMLLSFQRRSHAKLAFGKTGFDNQDLSKWQHFSDNVLKCASMRAFILHFRSDFIFSTGATNNRTMPVQVKNRRQAISWIDYGIVPQRTHASADRVNALRPSEAYMHYQPRPSLVQIIACGLIDAKPLLGPMLYYCRLDA